MHTLGLLTTKSHCLNLGQLIEKQFILNLSNVDTIFFFRKKRRCIISLPSLFINSAYIFSPRREIGCFELFTDKNFFKTSLVMHKFILLFQKRLLALDSLHTSFPLRISWANVTKPQFPADLVTFTEEILYGKPIFVQWVLLNFCMVPRSFYKLIC